MQIDYVQREYNEKYDICNNPEQFELLVDGEVINWTRKENSID